MATPDLDCLQLHQVAKTTQRWTVTHLHRVLHQRLVAQRNMSQIQIQFSRAVDTQSMGGILGSSAGHSMWVRAISWRGCWSAELVSPAGRFPRQLGPPTDAQ